MFANRGCEPCGPGLISLGRDWPSGWVSFRERTELNAKGNTFNPPAMQLWETQAPGVQERLAGGLSRILGCHDSAAPFLLHKYWAGPPGPAAVS